MDNNDLGRLPDGIGLSSAAPIEPVPVSSVPASIPSADQLLDLIVACEAAGEEAQASLLWSVGIALRRGGDRLRQLIAVDAYFSAALLLLPAEAAWRKFTDGGCSVYAGSPFNAAAQVRYDGHTSIDSLSLAAAILRLAHAYAAKAQAIEARRAATLGAVHESAVAASETPTLSPIGDNQ